MPKQAEGPASYKLHPFDLTKVWLHADVPRSSTVGVLELNRNPENYFAEVEQAAFNPGNVVPGISFSPDKMLQGRLFSYGDAQRYRLGVNHHLIPVNAPKNCPFQVSYQRDGASCAWTATMAGGAGPQLLSQQLWRMARAAGLP